MLKNPFALDASTNRVIHIDDARSAAGPFVCTGCEGTMSLVSDSVPYTRKGSDKFIVRREHFAHVSQDECSNGFETSMHMWAKLIIEEAMTIGLPIHRVSYREVERNFKTDWTYHDVTLEEWQEGIRPDVVLHHEAGRLNVEVKVHHAVDESKAALLRERAQSCVEIDLSGYDFDRTAGGDLREAILSHAPRTWIFHQLESERLRIVEDLWREGLAAQARQIHETLAAPTMPPKDQDHLEQMIALHDLDRWIGIDIRGEHWFREPSRYWQARVLLHLVKLSRNIGYAVTNGFDHEHRKHVPTHEAEMRGLPRYEKDLADTAGLEQASYGSPEAAVLSYLDAISIDPKADGYDHRHHLIGPGPKADTHSFNPTWIRSAWRRLELQREHAATFPRETSETDKTSAFLRWLETPVASKGRTPRRLCGNGGPDFYRLLAHANAVREMVCPYGRGPRVRHLLGIMTKEDAAERSAPEPEHAWHFRNPAARHALENHALTGNPKNAAAFALHRFDSKIPLDKPLERLGGASAATFIMDVPTMIWAIGLICELDQERRDAYRNRWRGSWGRTWRR